MHGLALIRGAESQVGPAAIVAALRRDGFDVSRDRVDATRLAVARGVDVGDLPSPEQIIERILSGEQQ